MYSIEQFIELSPPEAHSEDALSDEHQLMLNRLGFELVERRLHRRRKNYLNFQNPKLPRQKA